MSDTAGRPLSKRGRRIAVALALGIVAVFAAANAHLVYVALASQPDCVAADGSSYRAAKPSC